MREWEKTGKGIIKTKERWGRRAERKKEGPRTEKQREKNQLLVYLLCMRTYGAGLLTFVIIETMALSGSSPFESVRIISSPKSQKSCLWKEAKGEVLWTKHRTLPALKVLEQIRWSSYHTGKKMKNHFKTGWWRRTWRLGRLGLCLVEIRQRQALTQPGPECLLLPAWFHSYGRIHPPAADIPKECW